MTPCAAAPALRVPPVKRTPGGGTPIIIAIITDFLGSDRQQVPELLHNNPPAGAAHGRAGGPLGTESGPTPQMKSRDVVAPADLEAGLTAANAFGDDGPQK